ncbi:Uncharacterized protein APZ42_033312 [Daphnia magna]|uniref:Uncharacterized protein n=1 Tax=Daphnia magna TaxID=35525 RepID=A0A164L812_9CRUS|nr:Uncharacterized protein APZ42_033312 [Daphnia magna]
MCLNLNEPLLILSLSYYTTTFITLFTFDCCSLCLRHVNRSLHQDLSTFFFFFFSSSFSENTYLNFTSVFCFFFLFSFLRIVVAIVIR